MCVQLLSQWQVVALSVVAGVMLTPFLSWCGSTLLRSVTTGVRWLTHAARWWSADASGAGKSARP